MPYPKELLASGETVVHEFGSHWSALWPEVLATIAYVAVLMLLLPGINGWVFTILTLVWAWYAIGGFGEWKSVDHVLTTQRFVVRTGILRKAGYEFPLGVINDVAFKQNIFERALGVGDIMIETGGTKGQSVLRNIPSPEEKKEMISQARRTVTQSLARGAGDGQAGKSTAEQLEILGKLLDDGKLTRSEYDAQKSKLLG